MSRCRIAIGPGYTLLRLGRSREEVTNFEKAFAALGAPFRVLDVPDAAARDVYGFDLILVRPDLHVVWRGNRVPEPLGNIHLLATGHFPGQRHKSALRGINNDERQIVAVLGHRRRLHSRPWLAPGRLRACARRSARRSAEAGASRTGRAAERNEQKKAQREGDGARLRRRPGTAAPAAVSHADQHRSATAAAAARFKVVFLRATNFGGAIAASVFDVTERGRPEIHRHHQPRQQARISAQARALHLHGGERDPRTFMQATVIGAARTY